MDYRAISIARDHARTRGSSPALTGDGRTLTYAELDETSSRVAQALLSAGAGYGSRVAYIGKNSPEFFELMYGAAKIGAVITPVNWRLTPTEIAAIVADSQAPVTLVDGEFAEALRPLLPGLALVFGDSFTSWYGAHDATDPGFVGEPSDVVMQLYTSGTTGIPKGVPLTNANLSMGERLAPRWRLDESAVNMAAMPLFHIGGSGWALVGLYTGCHTILVRDFDPVATVELMERERVTNAFLVPAVLQFLCAVPGAGERDFSALRGLTYGASPITTTVLKLALDTFRAPLYQVYGMTETSGAITQLEPGDHDPEGPRAHLMRSAGRPYDWVELRIVDPATGDELPAGDVGELWTRSSQNTEGYWHRPDETARLLPGDGWLRTGDAGFLDPEGFLFLTDRIKDMIVTGGENVYPIQIEEVLAGHPEIADVAVIGVPDETWGETVKAVVVRIPGSDLGEADVIDYARSRLAGFMRPRSVDFADVLPRNPSGKILKKELRAPYWESVGRKIT